MEHSVVLNQRGYELPKKTMKVAEDIDNVIRIDSDPKISIREKYQKVYDFIVSVIGKENANEIFDTDNLQEMDLTDITLAFKKIVDAYNKPIDQYNSEKSYASLNSIPLDKIVGLVNAADKVKKK